MFLRIQLKFFNPFPALPADQRNSFGVAQTGPGGEVLGLTMGASKDFAHKSLLVAGY
jgi:hypothetical protein